MDPERSDKLPPVALAFKLEKGTFGQLTYMRMYQGHLKKGSSLINTRNGKSVRIGRLVKMHSSEMVDVDEVILFNEYTGGVGYNTRQVVTYNTRNLVTYNTLDPAKKWPITA